MVFADNQYYQRGMIQQFMMNLSHTLSQVWKLETGCSQKKFMELSYTKQVHKVAEYFDENTVKQLEIVGRIRNQWQKKVTVNHEKITKLFDEINFKIPKQLLKDDPRAVFECSFFLIQQMIVKLNNQDPLLSWWKNLKDGDPL